jgi:superfamily II DNA helicase RecQ
VLQPPAVLALTATAARATRAGILRLLSIPETNQIVASPLRDNLQLRVMHVTEGASKAGAVANHVVQLLKTGVACREAALFDRPDGCRTWIPYALHHRAMCQLRFTAGMSMKSQAVVSMQIDAGAFSII